MTPPTVGDFLQLLQSYVPPELSLHRLFQFLSNVVGLQPLVELNAEQRRRPHQREQTGWEKELNHLARQAFYPEEQFPSGEWDGIPPLEADTKLFVRDIGAFFDFLGWSVAELQEKFVIKPMELLCTAYRTCKFCGPGAALHREKPGVVTVSVIGADMQWNKAHLVMASCPRCRAVYHVDHITHRAAEGAGHKRVQVLDVQAQWIRISKTENLWIHRNIARMQECAIHRFHASWLGFTEFFNTAFLVGRLTIREEQMYKLFVENMVRRLVVAHGLENTFSCPPDPSPKALIAGLLEHLGRTRGILPGAFSHVCQGCTHAKRYVSDLEAEGAHMDAPAHAVADIDPTGGQVPLAPPYVSFNLDGTLEEGEVHNVAGPLGLPLGQGALAPMGPQQERPPVGGPGQFVRMAVMDGKTLHYRICAVQRCPNPLVNYSNGRFCADHIGLANICGLNSCNRPVNDEGAVTCDLPAHIGFYNAWRGRFGQESIHGVRRAIQRKSMWMTDPQPQLQDPPDIHPLAETGHTFCARHTYCLETLQWSCGFPIAWAIMYDSESLSQVLSFLNFTFPPDCPCPQFVAYDNACKLLSHIITQNPLDPWINTTRLVVDAWHYIHHRATDYICRTWCNPAPTNGSQPDLVVVTEDIHGNSQSVRAFNTETAEQLNARVDGYEAQMRQMTDWNFGFYVHAVLLLYKEAIEQGIEDQNHWIVGDNEMDVE